MKKVDMHTHTNLSNGSESSIYVLQQAQKNGVSVLSITDFNTLQFYLSLNMTEVRKYYTGLLVTGVEVNCKFAHYCSDMIGYNIKDLDRMQSWLRANTGKDNTKEAQMEQLEHYKQVARELALAFDEAIQLSDEQPLAGKVMANNLEHYTENIDKVKGIEKPSNFWVEHCSNIQSPFYFDMSRYRPSLEDFIQIVHECGGLVFVAHPFAYAGTEQKLQEYLETCKSYGVDGIECYQCYNENVTYATELPISFCKANGLYMSGGTDFHKRSGDPRYSGVGILGSEKIKNYAAYIPEEIVVPWIEPIQIQEPSKDDREDMSK